jgi:hypothetical protein
LIFQAEAPFPRASKAKDVFPRVTRSLRSKEPQDNTLKDTRTGLVVMKK